MALTTVKCPDCDGSGDQPVECEYCIETQWDCEAWADCHRCMGAGEVEIQRCSQTCDESSGTSSPDDSTNGTQDPYDEVPNRPRPGSNWAIFARWEQEREQ